MRRDLQGVRGLAVVGVVVYHLRSSWLPGGFAGVDVFFVLSGFFITGLLLRQIDRHGRVDVLAFWARRARRLLPASVLVIVTTLIAGGLLTNPLEAQRIARDGFYATAFGMNWREAASGLAYGQDPDPSPFQHYWSLGVEEQFYLAWPVLLTALVILCNYRRRWSVRATLVTFAAPAIVLSFLLALHQTGGDQPYAYYGTFGRVWQLAVGGLLAATGAGVRSGRPWLRHTIRPAGFALIINFFAFAPATTLYPGWWSLVPTLGAALLVAASPSASRHDPVAWLLTSRVGQLGGRYSYSWYLWHWAPLVVLPLALGRPLRVGELGLCAAGTLVLSIAAFHLLEDPVRRNRWLTQRRRGISLQLGGALMAVGLLTAWWTLSSAQHSAAGARIVTAGRHTLTPPPAAAEAQRSPLSNDGCQLPMTSAASAPECRYLPDVGRGDVVLVGDSHAGMWFPAVKKISTDNHWGLRVWARTSCPFADVRKSIAAGGEYQYCDRWRADVISRLLAAPPSLVIVASYAQSDLHVTDPATGAGATQTRAHQLLRAGLQRDLGKLRAAGLHVLLIGDVPGYTQPAPDCALTHQRHLASCSLPETQAIPYGGVDVEAARAVRGVRIADFTKDFCNHGRCYQVIGDLLAYRDMNHLTEQMALHLAAALARAARSAMA